MGQFHGWTEFPLGSLTLSRTPFRFDLHASFAYVGNQPLTSVDPLGLCIIQGVEFDDEDWPCQAVLWGIGIEVAGGHLGGGMGGGWAGGFPGGRRGGGGGRIGGRYPNGETLGLPTGLNLKPASLIDLLGLSPAASGTGCDFGVCVPIGSGYLAGAGGEGTPESPWIFYVVVWSPLAANNFAQKPPGSPPKPPDPNNYHCALLSSSADIGVCTFTCVPPDGMGGDIARIPVYVIQKACSTTNRSCPIALDVYPPSHWGPFEFGRPKVVPNSCVYGKVQ